MRSSSDLTRRQFLAGALAAAAAGLSCSKEAPKRKLFVYNWPYYMSSRVLLDFEEKFNATVIHETYDTGSDEELPEVLSAGKRPMDVVVPSGTILQKLIDRGLLSRLDRKKLPNFGNVLESFRGRNGDKGNEYSVPYMWGTIGIGLNAMKVQEVAPSWQLLLVPGKYWKCPLTGDLYPPPVAVRKIALLSTPWESVVPPVKSLGGSMAKPIPADTLERAKKALLYQKQTLQPLYADQVIGPLSSGKVWVAQGYSGDVLQARKIERAVRYLIPKEGTTKWVDSLCVPARAQDADLAHEFINYVLDGEVGATITNEIWYASPNGAAYKFIRPEILKDPAVFPREEVLGTCEWMEYDDATDRRVREVYQAVQGG